LSLGLWWAVWEAVCLAARHRPTWLELERAGRSLSRRETEVGFAADSLLGGNRIRTLGPPAEIEDLRIPRAGPFCRDQRNQKGCRTNGRAIEL
jgi:hypothetical protein